MHAVRPPSQLQALALIAASSLLLLIGCAPTRPASSNPPDASPTMLSDRAPADVVVGTEPWTYEDRQGRLISTVSYRIFTTSQREGLVRTLPLFMEMALDHYTAALGTLPRPGEPLEIYLFASRPQWERMTQRLMGKEAPVYLQIQRGGFSSGGTAVLFEIGARDTYAIAAHEGWHQYSQKTFKDQLPVAFEEGLATFMEGFRWDPSGAGRPIFLPWANIERFDQLRAAQANATLMPLATLVRSTPQELITESSDNALTYYAQVWALVHFLNEADSGRYRSGLYQMIADAASGTLRKRIAQEYGSRAATVYNLRREGVDLLKLYTGRSAEELDAPYQAFLGEITRLGAKQRIVQGKTPVE